MSVTPQEELDAEKWRDSTALIGIVNIPTLVRRLFEITIFNSKFDARHFCMDDARKFKVLANAIRRELKQKKGKNDGSG